MLWHYTNIAGFCGIVKNKNVYATSIRYLNDLEEFNHSISIARRILDDILNKFENDEPLKFSLPQIINGFFENGVLSPKKLNLFTASFTVNGDQLSQWRGYSKDSSGVSLGFDLRSFRPAPNSGTMVMFAPCVYNNGVKSELMHQAISGFVDACLTLSKRVVDKESIQTSINEIMYSQPGIDLVEAANLSQAKLLAQIYPEIKEAAAGLATNLLRLAGLLERFQDSYTQMIAGGII
jgi:hypothetical protein